MELMRKICIITVVLLLACNKSTYQVAEVEGVLTFSGKPADKVRLEFIPDSGTVGPHSVAETDAMGHFKPLLNDRNGSSRAGVVVGKHHVLLTDLRLSESATGQGIPIRFGPEYTLPASTPLTQEVTSEQ